MNGIRKPLLPRLLVASPELDCPFFERTVVLLVEHSDEGSFGLILNRESELGVDELLSEMGIPPDSPTGASVRLGGPVCTDMGWVVGHNTLGETLPERSTELPDGYFVSSSSALLTSIASQLGPELICMAVGYSGWSPGQLDEELEEGSWIEFEFDPSVLRGCAENMWTKALNSIGIQPAEWVAQLQVAEFN